MTARLGDGPGIAMTSVGLVGVLFMIGNGAGGVRVDTTRLFLNVECETPPRPRRRAEGELAQVSGGYDPVRMGALAVQPPDYWRRATMAS
jgi:hypothetical protein